MNTTTKDSLDDIFARISNHVYYPCKVCGKPESTWVEGDRCDECWDASPEKAAQLEEEDRMKTERARNYALEALRLIVSPEIQETDTEHPAFNRRAFDRIMSAFDPESSDWFWLHSHTSGRCKSRIAFLLLVKHLTAAIKHRIDKSGYLRGNLPTVLWVDGDRLTEACRTRHQFSLGDKVMSQAHELADAARTVSFLVIDDLTKRKITGEAASDGLWEIIKHRHEWKLRTIITDNFLPEGLEEMLHPKHAPYIIRRLAERCIQVDFDAA